LRVIGSAYDEPLTWLYCGKTTGRAARASVSGLLIPGTLALVAQPRNARSNFATFTVVSSCAGNAAAPFSIVLKRLS
jgi:hypothetical protein